MDHSFSPEVLIDQSHLYKEVTVGDRKIYYCLIADCGKDFRFKSELHRHLAVHTKQRPYVCTYPLCGKTFKRPDALTHHIKMHTENVIFPCPVEGCDIQFTTKAALKYHVLKHEGKKSYQCSFPGCNRAFITLAQLKQHERASFYHQKINANVPQVHKDIAKDIISTMKEKEVKVKEEATGSDSQVSEQNFGSPAMLGGAYKLLKTGSEGVQMNKILNNLHSLNSLNQLTMSEKLSWNFQVNSQNNIFGLVEEDPQAKDMLLNLVEENKRLKENLKGMMNFSFGDLYNGNINNFDTFQDNMNATYGFQPEDLHRQRLAALLQYNLSM